MARTIKCMFQVFAFLLMMSIGMMVILSLLQYDICMGHCSLYSLGWKSNLYAGKLYGKSNETREVDTRFPNVMVPSENSVTKQSIYKWTAEEKRNLKPYSPRKYFGRSSGKEITQQESGKSSTQYSKFWKSRQKALSSYQRYKPQSIEFQKRISNDLKDLQTQIIKRIKSKGERKLQRYKNHLKQRKEYDNLKKKGNRKSQQHQVKQKKQQQPQSTISKKQRSSDDKHSDISKMTEKEVDLRKKKQNQKSQQQQVEQKKQQQPQSTISKKQISSDDIHSDISKPTERRRDVVPEYDNVTLGIIQAPDFLTDELLRNHRDGLQPKKDICPYLGLRKRPLNEELLPPLKCQQHRPSNKSCQEARNYYDFDFSGSNRKPQCRGKRYPDICKFNPYGELTCNNTVCRKQELNLGAIDPVQGIITKWKPVNKDDIQRTVLRAVKANKQRGFDFIFLKCGKVLQALIFPPNVKTSRLKKPKNKISINIVLLDSISRPHFYRMMHKSVSALRHIVYDPSTPATVLDFELYQSTGQHTFDNMRPLFGGALLKDEVNPSSEIKAALNPLGISQLYGYFRRHGYQTLFQEDLCWYDYWGLMLTDIERRREPSDAESFTRRWSELRHKVSNYNIDFYGLLHFTCPVLKQYNVTNHFNTPPQVCLNGDFFSSYYLRYIASLSKATQNTPDAAPLISYSHFNTGHTYSGVRIRNMDEHLARFFKDMAVDRNSLTIVLSDHGHTSTYYARTDEGELELFNPFLFIILPYHVSSLLGKDKLLALVENQRRLFTTIDIHHLLMSLNADDDSNRDPPKSGILALLPSNRTCVDLDLMPLVRCKCENYDLSLPDDYPKKKWLAEFALGQINNLIQQQYTKVYKGFKAKSSFIDGTLIRTKCIKTMWIRPQHTPTDVELFFVKSRNFASDGTSAEANRWLQNYLEVPPGQGNHSSYGYGRCMRFVGKSFTHVVERHQHHVTTTIMEIHVAPPSGYQEDEIFKVEVHVNRANNRVSIEAYNRQSTYSKFKSCVDSTVDIKLCACAKGKSNSSVVMKTLILSPMFGSTITVREVYPGCVFLVARKHINELTVTYEVANLCEDRAFHVVIEGQVYNVLVTQQFPISLVVPPRTIHFVASTIKYVQRDSYLKIYPSAKIYDV